MLFPDSKYSRHNKRAHRETMFTREHEAYGTWRIHCALLFPRRPDSISGVPGSPGRAARSF